MIRFFNVSIARGVLALVISEAVILIACYVLAAFLTLWGDLDLYLFYDGGWLRILFAVAVVQLGLYFSNLYEDYRPRSLILLIQKFCLVMGVAFLLQAVIGYGRGFLQLPRWMMVCGSVLVLIVAPIWRTLFISLASKTLPARKLLFLGLSPTAREIVDYLSDRTDCGFAVIGYLESEALSEKPPAVERLGSIEDLRSVVKTHNPDCVVVGMPYGFKLPVEQLLELRFSGIRVEDTATTYETVFSRISLRDLRAEQVILSAVLGPQPLSIALQALYSFVLGVVGTVVALPLMAVIAVSVKFSSPGPALLRQKRVGLNGKPFIVFKFRSMYQDAETRSGAVWATKDDPRITPIGRWLRQLRLDELPQFFNVLLGTMALVGPRPERPEFVSILEKQIPFYNQRHCIKPGITGWAQINHKYADTVEDTVTKLEYDLYYIKNLTPALDAYIIFHTLKVMLLSRGSQ